MVAAGGTDPPYFTGLVCSVVIRFIAGIGFRHLMGIHCPPIVRRGARRLDPTPTNEDQQDRSAKLVGATRNVLLVPRTRRTQLNVPQRVASTNRSVGCRKPQNSCATHLTRFAS